MTLIQKIKNEIREKPKIHLYLFTCWGMCVISWFVGASWKPFIAAGFVIAAIIDAGE